MTTIRLRYKNILLGMAVLGMLSACGFTLKGAGNTLPADWQSLAIESNLPRDQVLTALERELRYAGVDTNNTSADARRVLVQLDQRENRPLYLDAISRTAEMEYSQRATISVSKDDGSLIHGPVSIEVRRVLANDPDNPVGERSETDLVTRELAESLAQRIMQQLARWAEQTDR